MTAIVYSQDQLRITLISATCQAGLAAGVLASHLSMDHAQAARRLSRAPSVLAEAAPASVARRIQVLLTALGVRVRLDDPAGLMIGEDWVDVAVQALEDVPPDSVAAIALRLGINTEEVDAALQTPAGVVCAMTTGDADRLRRALRRETSVRVTRSDPVTAMHDLFLHPGAQPTRHLLRTLRLLGLTGCPFSGAIAGALDTRTATIVVSRHSDVVYMMNRDFQRFDLFLKARNGVSMRELADFFATRAAHRRHGLPVQESTGPMRIETGLTRAAARQFKADYAAIGIETSVSLSVSGPLSQQLPAKSM